MQGYVQNRITEIAIEYGEGLSKAETAFLMEMLPDDDWNLADLIMGECRTYYKVENEDARNARKSLSDKGLIEDDGSYVKITGRGGIVQDYLYAKEVDYEMSHY